ncbi:3-oxoacyl-[acyl-carrier-protein] synthase [Schistosoma japonicum]|uniref:beta-ketoacyl-[acyl-carrier-protein] synthase I n=1 Tax=Schistosoma japonicum TaxID=6182 RepID=A0A4Z2D8I6_SCHJA|nr:3-oxoacyl-[acyl-carrier-protein] synthase [Schistosoma japonicum]
MNSGYRAGVYFGVGMDGPIEVMNTSSGILTKTYSTIGPHALTRTLGNIPAGIISRIWGLRGPCMTVNTACAAGLHCIGEAYRMIQNNEADLVVAGACESPLNAWTIAAFCRLRALCTQCNDTPEQASRPFDSLRKGFVLSEGAAAVVLQAWPPPTDFLLQSFEELPKPIAEIIGFGRSGDAYHLVAPDSTGSGALRSMLNAFNDSKLTDLNEIGHINCHATSTTVGDLVELSAIAQMFGECFTSQNHSPIVINSIKGHLGHCLAAAGAVETVYAALSVNRSLICGNLNLHNPISDYELMEHLKSNPKYVSSIFFIEKCMDLFKNYAVLPKHNEMQVTWPSNRRRIAMVNSFGFGGTNGTLLISEWTD